MNPVVDFFTRLLGVHLLFWLLSFKRFDALALLATIGVVLGADDFLSNKSVAGASISIALQFVLYVSSFVLCAFWPPFRQNFVDVASNMICLALSIAVCAGLLAFVLKFMILVPPLDDTLGRFIVQLIRDFRHLSSWDSGFLLSALLFAVAYALIVANTLAAVGGQRLLQAFSSAEIVPLIVSFGMSFLATLVVVWPIYRTFGI
jgi:hypothetical protein